MKLDILIQNTRNLVHVILDWNIFHRKDAILTTEAYSASSCWDVDLKLN